MNGSHSELCLVIAGIISLSVYGLTLAPDLTWSHYGADGGDFVTAAVTGRIPHPPGFPVYMALADAFVRLGSGLFPEHPPAWRLNFLSAVMASATVMVLAWILTDGLNPPVRSSDFSRSESFWVRLATSLALAFAPLFWSQALITEAYTTAAFFVVLSLAFWIKSNRSAYPRRWRFGAGLAWGLGISVHLTLIFMFPLWIIWHRFCAARKHAARKHAARKHAARKYARMFGVGVLLGLLPYVGVSLRGSWPQPWGDLRSFEGWWNVVSGRLYWGFAFGLPAAAWFQRVLAYVALLVRQFTPVGALLVLQGGRRLWVRHRAQMVGLVSTFGLGSLYAMGYNTPDSVVYLVPLLPLVALCLREGLAWLVQKGWPAWSALLLPLALLGLHWGILDLHNDREAVNWIEQILDQTPRDAILLTAQDHHTFALWYAQTGLRLRPDVLVVDRDLWAEESYRHFLIDKVYPADGFYPPTFGNRIEMGAQVDVELLRQTQDDKRPLCYVKDQEVDCQ